MKGLRMMLLLGLVGLGSNLWAQYWNPNWIIRLSHRIRPIDLHALYPDPCIDYDQYVQVYKDEFDGDSLDHWFWRPDLLNFHHSPSADETNEYNSEDQLLFTSNNNGTLTIQIENDPIYARGVDFLPDTYAFFDDEPNLRTWPYQSGAITSNWNLHYGRYSSRIQVPSGKYMWPAFWLYGTCGSEIDVFEFQEEGSDHGHDRKPSFSTHESFESCDGESHGSTRTVNLNQNLTLGFHTYTLTWDDFLIRFKVDGQVITTFFHYYEVDPVNLMGYTGIEDCQSIPNSGIFVEDPIYPDVMMKIIANAGVLKSASASAFPREMKLDYILVQERMDCQGTTVITDSTDMLGIGGRDDRGDRSITDGFVMIDPFDSLILRGIPVNTPWEKGDFAILTAASEIVIKPDFGVELGANLIAQIRTCQSSSKMEGEESLDKQPKQIIQITEDTLVSGQTDSTAWQFPGNRIPILSPNPASSVCKVSGLQSGDELVIIDLFGKHVQPPVISAGDSISFPLSSLRTGIYMVRISRNGEQFWVLKLVKL